MGGVHDRLQVNGYKYLTLFDSGARNTYVTPDVARHLLSWKDPQTEPVALGGKVHHVRQGCMLMAKIRGRWVKTHARVIERIGKDEQGRPIDILFGALAMQEWGIELNLKSEKVDLTHYSKEFVEF